VTIYNPSLSDASITVMLVAIFKEMMMMMITNSRTSRWLVVDGNENQWRGKINGTERRYRKRGKMRGGEEEKLKRKEDRF
jgi:hypothetical protein